MTSMAANMSTVGWTQIGKCVICKEWVRWYPKTGVAKGSDCSMNYHDEEYLGLGRDDQVSLLKKRRKDWTAPNQTQRRANARHVARLKMTGESNYDKDTDGQ
jgi:hypothetical protein